MIFRTDKDTDTPTHKLVQLLLSPSASSSSSTLLGHHVSSVAVEETNRFSALDTSATCNKASPCRGCLAQYSIQPGIKTG